MCKSSFNLFYINFVGFQLLFPLSDGNLGIKYEKKSIKPYRLIMSANNMMLIFFSLSMTYFVSNK